MKKHLLFYLVLLSFSYTNYAQLSAGDIAFLGLNTDSTEGFSFITLADIPPSEVIYFTDRGVVSASAWNPAEEDTWTFTAPAGGINCGTIVTCTDVGETFSVSGISGATLIWVDGPTLSTNINFGGGDQILAFQAASATPATPGDATFIAGMHTNYSIGGDVNGTTLWTNSTDVSNTSESALPPGLVNGETAISFDFGSTNSSQEDDNYRYTGTLTGTSTVLQTTINNAANWERNRGPVYNISSSGYNVTDVTCVAADTEPPMITCPADVNTGNETGVCGNGVVNIGMATATDNVGVTSITNDAPMTFAIGTTMVIWTAEDAAGNMATCTQSVTINDTELPQVACSGAITVQADPGENFATGVSLSPPISTDNCGVASVTNNAPMSFPLGATNVTWTVTDTVGNMATCIQMVTVNLCNGMAAYIGGGFWIPAAPTSNDTATLAADYDTATFGNISACSIVVNPGITLTVNAGGFVQSVTDITVNGTLIVEHTGSVVQLNNTSTTLGSGGINVNVTTPMLDTRDFMLLGSPMSGETREDVWSTAYNVQFYNTASFVPNAAVGATGVVYNFSCENTDDWNLLTTGALMPGEGYLVFPQDSFNGAGGVFNYNYNNGIFNNGVITRPLTFNTTAENSPNMFSNPYPSGINADLFLAANTEINALYFWEHLTAPDSGTPGPYTNNYNMDDISVYNAIGGAAAANGGVAPTGVVATAQGFGVFASAAGTATFNNSMRVTTGNTTLRTVDENTNRLWVNVRSEAYGVGSNALVGFTSNATAGYEAAYDSPRLATIVSLHSNIGTDFENGYIIQGREAFNTDIQVPFSFATTVDENTAYRISLSDFDGDVWDTENVYLVDHATGITTNLSKNDYVFTSEIGTYNGRFTVQFRDASLGTNDIDLHAITLYPNPTTAMVTIVSPRALVSGVVVTDIQGRIVENITIDSVNNYQLDLSQLGSAVYFVKVTTDAGSISKRIIKK